MNAKITSVSAITKAANELLHDAKHGNVAGVTIISYSDDWSFVISNAGSILRMPGAGIVAAHVLASEMESKLRTGSALEPRRA